MQTFRAMLSAVAIALGAAQASGAAAAGFVDVLDQPALVSPLATKGLLQAVTRAGDRLVAVGQRGHVVVSADGGASWKQTQVPVSSDLTAVHFVDAGTGWAVGHDGVILVTRDGGESWRVQLDGRKANELLLAAMKRKADVEPASAEAKRLLAEAERFSEQGADKPFLDVWFADASNGYAIGAFNLIFRTDDGGSTWTPWFDRTDNPKLFNLYAIRPVAGDVYIAGEGGLVLKLDPSAQRFKALEVPYEGSLFGVAAANSSVLVFGLRGNVFRSDDAGRSWTKVDAGLANAVVASARTSRDATLVADVGGRIAATQDGGRTFTRLAVKQAVPVTGLVEAAEGRLALVGPRGVTVTETSTR
jgi:photosystem II stability/assembly factor-like uncharacterized protein